MEKADTQTPATTNPVFVIGVLGKKGDGKDTLYKAINLVSPIPVYRVAFGDAMKEEVSDAILFRDFAVEAMATKYGIDICKLHPPTHEGKRVEWVDRNKTILRPILQFWGTEYRRAQDPLYWIKQVEVKVDEILRDNEKCIIVLTDVRFANEIMCCRSYGGVTVRVVNPRRVDNDTHVSETAVAEVPTSYTVINDKDLVSMAIEADHLLKKVLSQ